MNDPSLIIEEVGFIEKFSEEGGII